MYFAQFNELVLQNKAYFRFTNRNKRPPTDPVNALLSFAYTILANDCAAALEGAGLDPYIGFMHRDRPGRLSLALDLMEEFRSIIADRFVLTLINNRKAETTSSWKALAVMAMMGIACDSGEWDARMAAVAA